MSDFRNKKAGAAAVDPDKYNAVIDGLLTASGLPAGGTTGQFLEKASNADGDAVWGDGGGGSLPDDSGFSIGAVLQLVAQFVASALSPTAGQLDTDARLAPLLVEGWTPLTDYVALRNAEGGAGSLLDIVQLLRPTGNANIFIAEATNNTHGGQTEPDWSTAPNVGDSVSDGDYTWYNAGLFADWPFTPTTWTAETVYPAGSLVWPTVPNGHLYVAFPPGPLTSDVTEPVFPTNGDYVADNDGYWWDAGQAAELVGGWGSSGLLQKLVLQGIAGQGGAMLGVHQADADSQGFQFFNDVFSKSLAQLEVAIANDGTINYLADTPFNLFFDPWMRLTAVGTRDAIDPIQFTNTTLTFDAQSTPTILAGLPTADPMVEGQLWDDSGVLSISHPPGP